MQNCKRRGPKNRLNGAKINEQRPPAQVSKIGKDKLKKYRKVVPSINIKISKILMLNCLYWKTNFKQDVDFESEKKETVWETSKLMFR